MDIKINSGEDYWKVFDLLCSKMLENRKDIYDQFKDAQNYVNGLTDGWHGFLDNFQLTIKNNKERLTKEELEIANYLVKTLLKTTLHNR